MGSPWCRLAAMLGALVVSLPATAQVALDALPATYVHPTVITPAFPGKFYYYQNPNRMVIGDFNGDHLPDAVLLDPVRGTAQMWLNKGTGTFQLAGEFSAGAGAAFGVAADFDRDGKLDLAVINPGVTDTQGNIKTATRQISILLGNGNGTFQTPKSVSVSGQPNAIATADFNGDGRPDIAVLSAENNTVTLLTNNGAATFASSSIALPKTSIAGQIGNDAPHSLVVGDFNGDGKADMAYVEESTLWDSVMEVNYQNSLIYLVTNKGANKFAVAYSGERGLNGILLRVADVNGDGKSDLLYRDEDDALRYQIRAITVAQSNGNGTFTDILISDVTQFENVLDFEDMAVADFDRDGINDVVVSSASGLIFYGGTGNGRTTGVYFRDPVVVPSNTNNLPYAMVGALLNSSPAKGLFLLNQPADGSQSKSVTLQTVVNKASGAKDPCSYPTTPGVHACTPSGALARGAGYVHFRASARGNAPLVQRMEVWIDGTKKLQVLDDHVSYDLYVGSGAHKVTFVEVDALGKSISKSLSFSLR